ncbi:MAG: hypothetical protein EOM55_00635 [Clostridia bacterium]|nr:hypothetical protein [Clostridia bacterium]
MRNNIFKKISVIGVFCVIIISSFLFCACNEENYSKADVDTIYSAILDDYCDTKGYIDININASKVVHTEAVSDDKYYIFPYILDNYVSFSSGLVFSVASRQNGILFSLGSFSQKELNDVYAKFSNVLTSLNSLDEIKNIYENSDGYLQYDELINAYFVLIDNLYSLSDSFSDYYFDSLYSSNFSASNVAKGSLSDLFWFELFSLSKVSYIYDLKNMNSIESEGEVVTWFNNTRVLKTFVNDSADILSALKLNNDLSYGTNLTHKTNLAGIISNMLDLKSAFERDFNNFVIASSGFFLNEYLNATNRTSYLQNCSEFENSKFNLINEFILGRYEAFLSGIRMSKYNINV